MIMRPLQKISNLKSKGTDTSALTLLALTRVSIIVLTTSHFELLYRVVCCSCSLHLHDKEAQTSTTIFHMTAFRSNALLKFRTPRVSEPPKAKPLLNLNLNAQNYVDARMIKTGFDPNICRSNFLVKNFLKRGELSQARILFDQMPHKNTVSTNMMISSYVNSGNLYEARELLDTMLDRTAVTWTILIGGYSQASQYREAFKLYAEMHRWGTKPDYVTFATLLSGCSDMETTKQVVQVHSHILKLGYHSTLMVCNSLLDSYCKSHRLDLACRLFKEMPERDNVTFNALITGYSKDGLNEEAINLFAQMQNLGYKPSEFTFAALLCADFYSKHDCSVEVRKLFDEMPELDGISYNVIITSYVWDGHFKMSLDLFRELQLTKYDRKQFPYATMLSIASNTLNLNMGQQIHSQAIVATADSEIQVGNSLVDMYAKCGRFEEAKRIFARLADRSAVPWTAIISAYVQNGLHVEALELFNEMRRANVSPDQATFASILRASANLASLSLGKQLHSSVIRLGFASNVFAGSYGFRGDAMGNLQ
ncbi:hypothetical protein GBA52_025615 [Prunus armeniaca]|nr:hypothetical protein GBA52_025615 [Prunus armeniaca]